MASVIRSLALGVFCIALGCGLLASPAAAQEWAPFGMSQTGDAITLDRRSVLKEGGNASFTMRVDFNKLADVNGKEARSLQTRIEINCAKATYRRAEETFLDTAGKVISTTPGAGWLPIPANSFGNALRNFCK